MAEISDEQLAQIQAERDQERQRAQQAQAQMEQAREAYARDIQQVSAYVANVLSQPNQGQGQPQAAPDESDLFVQHPQLERQIEERVNRKLIPIAQKYFVDQAQTVMRMARADPSMPHYQKYQGEIEQLLGAAIQMNPSLANMNTVQQAYRLVLSQHVDDLVEERARARASRPVEDEEEASADEAAPPVLAPAPGPGRSAPPVALGTSGAHPATTPPKKRVRLSEGEANMARVLNIDPAEYAAYRDPNIEVDVLGFKGRRRV